MELWYAIRFLHVLAMAFFIGGQLLLAAAVVPVMRGNDPGARMRQIARRFGWGTLVAIAVLFVTGAAMAGEYHRWSDPALHVKLTLVAVVAGLVFWHMRRPDLRAIDGAIFLLSLAIVWLGITIAH
ncbi:hypothetical protein JDY09_00990 [Thermoleophilum album]|uniref:hypothetical protein n=1 Tax=Thermoleophilum album TaxID=29539 RepID=UPI000CAF4E26|nr:hypothetical protein [Thermoleophilum album]MCL6440428.1 hypothetical protein [Thermoleophilum sp.]WDT93868.1 hypothetical protein JDY09_00990 [Thermoleophilum album]GBD46405.1 hypothetical protein HRbin41_01231 [bacterium HR41]